MLTRSKLLLSFAVALITAAASADPLVYAVNFNQQFGTVNLSTGNFHQIGPTIPDVAAGLVSGPNDSLLTLTVSGNLDAINPKTGVTSVIGATGLGGNANTLAKVGGSIYATDLNNNLYTVNPTSGAATLIGPTGIPAVPAYPFTTNPDGSLNLFDESLYGVGGKLYATFDAFALGTDNYTTNFTVDPNLYQIDPVTGLATLISSTAPQILSIVDVNGTMYAFQGSFTPSNPFFNPNIWTSTLNLTNGTTTFLSSSDATPTFGAAPAVPEPASLALVGTGLVALASKFRRRHP